MAFSPFSPIPLLSVLLHALLAWRLLPSLASWPLAQALFGAFLLASAVMMPLGLMMGRASKARRRLATLVTWASLLFMGAFSSLFVLSLLRDTMLLAGALVLALAPAAFDMATLRVLSAAAVPLVASVVTLWGFLNARRTAAVVAVDVPIRDLPPALHGFTIAQISDIHIGTTIRRDYLSAIVAKVNRLDADMVAVTGDLVDGSVPELGQHVAPLAQLSSRHGTYFVTGNHEYYSGAAAWVVELRRIGVRVLMNEHVMLQHGEGILLVAGVNDYGAHHFDPAQRSDPVKSLAGAPPEARVKVLLAHQPRSAEAAADAGFHLQLSGHTHGGQFLPWNFFVRLQQPFTAGLHRLRDLWVYTSRGTGYWGPPKRFGAPSEITRLRLVPA